MEYHLHAVRNDEARRIIAVLASRLFELIDKDKLAASGRKLLFLHDRVEAISVADGRLPISFYNVYKEQVPEDDDLSGIRNVLNRSSSKPTQAPKYPVLLRISGLGTGVDLELAKVINLSPAAYVINAALDSDIARLAAQSKPPTAEIPTTEKNVPL